MTIWINMRDKDPGKYCCSEGCKELWTVPTSYRDDDYYLCKSHAPVPWADTEEGKRAIRESNEKNGV